MTQPISQALRILLLAPLATPFPAFLKEDLAHHEICTSYYTASVPIWRDELPTSTSGLTAWEDEWKDLNAAEVVHAIGAWIICFRKPNTQDDLRTIQNLLNTVHDVLGHHTTSTYSALEPLLFAVGMQQTSVPSLKMTNDEWENICRECGHWEWIDGTLNASSSAPPLQAKNEYGEEVGIARLREALEAHDWESRDAYGDSDDLELEAGFDMEAEELHKEMRGLQTAVRGPEDDRSQTEDAAILQRGDNDVQELEAMLLKMQAIKDIGADLPGPERRRFAARAVKDVMKTM